MWIVLESNHWLHHIARSLLPTVLWIIYLALKMDVGWLCRFFSYGTFENKVHLVLECPLYNPIRGKFLSLFEKVVPRSLESFFQVDQVDIALYNMEATTLHHSTTQMKTVGLKPSWRTFNHIKLFCFPNSKLNFITFHFTSLQSFLWAHESLDLPKHHIWLQ